GLRRVVSSRLHPSLPFDAPADHLDHAAAPRIELARILGVHVDECVRHGPMQLVDTLGHAAGVPVLQNATGAEPEWVFLVRYLGGNLVGQRSEEHTSELQSRE